jgi:hypothetical protein
MELHAEAAPAAPRRAPLVLRPFLALKRFLSSRWRRQRPHEFLHPDLVSAVLAAAAESDGRPQQVEALLSTWRDSPVVSEEKDELKPALRALKHALHRIEMEGLDKNGWSWMRALINGNGGQAGG